MTDFIANLLKALFVVANITKQLTFTINSSTISLFDTLEYCGIISLVCWAIKETSYNGLFSIKGKRNEERLEKGVNNGN